MTGPAIRVLLSDDHALVRQSLAGLLGGFPGITVVGAAADGAEAVELALRLEPDVVLMDLSMPVMDGVEATRRVVEQLPGVRVVVLTSFAHDDRVLDALGAGATGYLLKDAEPAEVVRGIQAAARGEAPLDPRAARAVLTRRPVGHSSVAAGMTTREREVLLLVSAGMANKLIARRLGISEATVKAHLTRIYRHIGVTDRTQAAIWARDHAQALRDEGSAD
jgi:DNA-binding NarL/FixJ family response regulator